MIVKFETNKFESIGQATHLEKCTTLFSNFVGLFSQGNILIKVVDLT